jgi:cell division protease FtsH
MVTAYGMSAKLGAVKYGTEHGDPFLGRSMGTQADYSHEVAREIDEEVRKLIEAAHTEAWEILSENRDALDRLAGELLDKETLHRAELNRVLDDVRKRPRITAFDDFGGRVPSDRPPIKTPGELAIERGEEWPKPVPEPAFKTAIAAAEAARRAAGGPNGTNGSNGHGSNGAPAPAPGNTQPDYGAPGRVLVPTAAAGPAARRMAAAAPELSGSALPAAALSAAWPTGAPRRPATGREPAQPAGAGLITNGG